MEKVKFLEEAIFLGGLIRVQSLQFSISKNNIRKTTYDRILAVNSLGTIIALGIALHGFYE